MEEKYYTPDELAELLKVSRRSVYTWIKEEKVDAVKIGASWRIPASAVEKLTAFGNMSHLKRLAESLNLTIESKTDNSTRLKGYALLDSSGKAVAGEGCSLSVEELAETLSRMKTGK